MKKTNVFGILCLGFSMSGFGQQEIDTTQVEKIEEVVISDSRFKLKRENSGKTVIKISKEEIENNQGRTVDELINTKSGIEINGSRSNPGQNLGIYVRGGRNRQVLVLIDGVQANDPSQLNGEYDFRLLNLSQIESIEIIKGAASTLYGSGAATAVINITTKKSSAKKANLVLNSSLGTNQSESDQNYNISDFKNSVSLNGTLNKLTYRAGFSNQFADGLSSAITTENEKDPYSKYGLDLNFGYQFTDALSLNIYGNRTAINTDYDGGAFFDADNKFKSEQSRVGLASKYKYANGSLNLNAAYSKYDREFISNFPSVLDSKNYVLDLYNKYTFNNKFYTIIGVNAIENSAIFKSGNDFNEEQFTIIDPYANVVYVSDFGLNVNAGVRFNNHSEYGSHVTYNLNPSYTYKLENNKYAKVFASYSTSYITPSLSQLFGAFGPNPNLEPEENATIEGGLEYKFSSKLRASALYFNREETNFFVFDFVDGYLNSEDQIETQGIEIEVEAMPIKNLNITANYTFIENKEELPVRIPKHKANVQLGYKICSKTFAALSYQYTDNRIFNDFRSFPAEKVTLESFSLVNFSINHTFNNHIKLFGNVDNLLNEDYADVFGFTSRGRNVRLGLQLSL